eukprot:2064425-Amphidinium_carterae.2
MFATTKTGKREAAWSEGAEGTSHARLQEDNGSSLVSALASTATVLSLAHSSATAPPRSLRPTGVDYGVA